MGVISQPVYHYDMQEDSRMQSVAAIRNIQDIYNDVICLDWIESFKSQSTRHLYATGLLLFCRFHKSSPSELKKQSAEKLQAIIMEYVRYLKKNAKQTAGKGRRGTLSVNSIRSYMCGVQSFIDYVTDVPINWKTLKRAYPEEVSNNLRSYKRDEIQKLLTLGDLRAKVIMLLMVSSGIRVGAIPELTFKSLVRLGENYSNVAFIVVYGNSKKAKYVSLISGECLEAIDAYRDFRLRWHENVKEDSPLVRDKFQEFANNTNNPIAIQAKSINRIVKELLKRAGLPVAELQPDHSFRKYFNTMAKTAGIDHMFKEVLMGHSVKLDDIYFDIEVPEARERVISEYLKALPLLTMSDENRLQIKVSKLETEKDALINTLENRLTTLEESYITHANKQMSALNEIGISSDQMVKLLHLADVFKLIDKGNPEDTLGRIMKIYTRPIENL